MTEATQSRVLKLREWLEKAVVTKVKHIVTTFVLIVVIMVGNQVQVGALTERGRLQDQRATYEAATLAYDGCIQRVESRDALRAVFIRSFDFDQGIIDFLNGAIDNREGDPPEYLVLLTGSLTNELAAIRHDLETEYPSYGDPIDHCGQPPEEP